MTSVTYLVSLLLVSTSPQVVAFERWEGTRAFVSRLVWGVWLVNRTSSPLWSLSDPLSLDSSVEHADSQPAGSPTAIAFYSGGSGLLRESDLIASVSS